MLSRLPRPAALLAAWLLSLVCLPALAWADSDKLETRCYQVADLVIPLSRSTAALPGADSTEKPAQAEPKTLEDRLIGLIVQTVEPDSWSVVGGSGVIAYFPLTMSLVVRQVPAIHEKVQDLLTTLRRLQDQEVALEVRLVAVADDFLEQTGLSPNETFLNDRQVYHLLESAQGDARTNVLQAPKLTVFNGQSATVNITNTQYFLTGVEWVASEKQTTIRPKNEPTTTGIRMTTQPVVSADRRFVQVYLKIDQTELASAVPQVSVSLPVAGNNGKAAPVTQLLQQPQLTSLTVEKTVVVPDGGTVVFFGFKKQTETRYENGPPVLSKVPYLNRLFKNVGYGTEAQTLLILVTPRIIINENEEASVAEQCGYGQGGYCQAVVKGPKKAPRKCEEPAAEDEETDPAPAASPEEERLKHFWGDYYHALKKYYAILSDIDWVAFYKNHGYPIYHSASGWHQRLDSLSSGHCQSHDAAGCSSHADGGTARPLPGLSAAGRRASGRLAWPGHASASPASRVSDHGRRLFRGEWVCASPSHASASSAPDHGGTRLL